MNSDKNSSVCGMSVDNIFSSEVYHNEQLVYDTQWKCDINKNVLKIILLMKEHNRKAKYVDISILLWFCLGGHMSKFRQGCSSYFLGLKFGQILFFWVGKFFSYLSGFRKISTIFWV